MLRPVLAARTTAWLAERLTANGIMNGRVNSYQEFLQEEQVAATGIMSWLAQPGVPELVPMPNIPGLPPFESGTKRAHAPTLGRAHAGGAGRARLFGGRDRGAVREKGGGW